MALSLFVCQQATGIGLGTLRKPGPGLLAFGTGIGIGVLALVLLIKSLVLKANQVELDHNERRIRKGKFLAICASLFCYAIAVDWLGFVFSTFVFVHLVLHSLESEKWWFTALKAALVTIGNYLVFVVWLGISLPKGILPW
jgi:putative tricarboxylic transport membrane protein